MAIFQVNLGKTCVYITTESASSPDTQVSDVLNPKTVC